MRRGRAGRAAWGRRRYTSRRDEPAPPAAQRTPMPPTSCGRGMSSLWVASCCRLCVLH